ncbi:major facilitator superfamily domain-containing protein 9-like isoform X2 [Dreissena polymorpha]|uniref:major facilitator superfamily domain-containing protein 9-like isoform X2 n=1 Tax=Dreissena polymorpha TaxID=45954 RepID=UPI002264467D|nr:major facilitator superfamily domain-containing protein 9-like isoform X2 [Dreissena polymorpha]
MKTVANGNAVLIMYVCGFLDLLGVSMILPLITSHAKDLGASSTVSGVLGKQFGINYGTCRKQTEPMFWKHLSGCTHYGSLYGALQLFTSPIMGQWSDGTGRRFTLLMCLLISATGYCMFSWATTLTLMFIARIPLGIFKHSQSIGKAYLVDIVQESERSKVIGNFNAASSLGFIVGPVFGGHIADRPGGFYLVALSAGLLFYLNFILMWLTLPNENAHHAMKKGLESSASLKQLQSDEINFNPKTFIQTAKELNWQELWDLYFIKFLLAAAVIIFRSNFSLILMQKYETTPVINGYIISFNGVISALVGLFTGYFASFYSSHAKLVLHLAILQGFILLGLALSPTLFWFVIFLIPLCFVTTIARVSATSLMLERGRKQEAGILIGFQQSCLSMSRMVAPLIAGLAQELTPAAPACLGAALSLAAVSIMIIRPQDPRNRTKWQ